MTSFRTNNSRNSSPWTKIRDFISKIQDTEVLKHTKARNNGRNTWVFFFFKYTKITSNAILNLETVEFRKSLMDIRVEGNECCSSRDKLWNSILIYVPNLKYIWGPNQSYPHTISCNNTKLFQIIFLLKNLTEFTIKTYVCDNKFL